PATPHSVSLINTNAGGITVGGDQDFSAKGNDNLTLSASAGSIIGGAGRITTSGAVTLAGIGVGTAAAPVLTNLGGTGTLNISTTGAGSAGDIAISDNAPAGLKLGSPSNIV